MVSLQRGGIWGGAWTGAGGVERQQGWESGGEGGSKGRRHISTRRGPEAAGVGVDAIWRGLARGRVPKHLGGTRDTCALHGVA